MMTEIERAVQILQRGGLVAFPTETVYGLGADAANERAIARLFAVKGRPADHPVIVHFADAQHALTWAREVPQAAVKLASKFWPGPLTLILRRAPHVGAFITGGQDTVGLRVPAHPLAQALLAGFGGGLAAPSANRFGRVSPTTAQHVRDDLGDDVDLILDGGPCAVGIESSIVDMSRGAPALLRPGGVSVAELEAALDEPLRGRDRGAPRAPGGLPAHYAPRTPLRLVAPHALDTEIARAGGPVAALAFSRADVHVEFWLRMPRDPQAYAQRLYGALRELDCAGCALLLVEAPPDEPPWRAVLDRLRRAARD